MRISTTSDLWWKTAVVYCLDVETYLDQGGDGRGDLAGVVQRIDHLADLGVTCLWLMPFYPTPDRDDGYDITDFYGVDDRLGTHGDLVELIRTASMRKPDSPCSSQKPMTCASSSRTRGLATLRSGWWE